MVHRNRNAQLNAKDIALKLLTRREHSRRELWQKLTTRGIAEETIKATLDALEEQNFLSDERFTKAFIRYRVGLGYGPLHIAAELQKRGIDHKFAAKELDSVDTDWFQMARKAVKSRFGRDRVAQTSDLCMRKLRFLAQRGFPLEIAHQVSRMSDADDAEYD